MVCGNLFFSCLISFVTNDIFLFVTFLLATSLAFLFTQFSYLLGGKLNYILCIVLWITSLLSGSYLLSWYLFENVVGCLLFIAFCLIISFIMFKLAMIETPYSAHSQRRYTDGH